MIRIGLRTEFEFVPEAAGLGFDYLEIPLTRVAALTDDEFEELCDYFEAANIRVEAMYDMLPANLRVNGINVRAGDHHGYLEMAFRRAKRLGAEVIAFDAKQARSVPATMDFALARRQTGNFLRIVQGHAVTNGVKVAIQNLKYTECNLINTVSEAALMAALLQLSQVGVLANTVHMAYQSEPLDAILRCGTELKHVHTGNGVTRTLPSINDGEDYVKLFRILRRIGYSGRVSAVATGEYTAEAASEALRCLRAAMREAYS